MENTFLESSPEERKNLLIALDKEQKDYTASKKPTDPAHYFRMMKELTIWGYFYIRTRCYQGASVYCSARQI